VPTTPTHFYEHLRHAKTDFNTFPMLKNHLDKPHRLTCSINPSEGKQKQKTREASDLRDRG